MKVHKLEIIILDFEGYSDEDIKCELEQMSMSATVLGMETITIRKWDDDHPLNQSDVTQETVEKYFKKGKKND